MEKTAVEKFIEQLEEKGESWENVSIGKIQISIKVEDYLELKKQAKEMEKEQKGYNEGDLKYAFDSGRVRLTFDKNRPYVFKDFIDFIKQFKNL